MTGVISSENESFESLLKRFNKKVQQTGILKELRRRKYFEKPSARRKRKKRIKETQCRQGNENGKVASIP